MSWWPLFAYIGAVAMAAATPGPAMFTVVSSAISQGFWQGLAVGIGIALGDAILVTLALTSLIIVAQSYDWVLTVVKYAGAFYLIWMGVKMLRSRLDPSTAACSSRPSRALGLGLSMGLANPKAVLFHASVMPVILHLSDINTADGIFVVGSVLATNVAVMSVYSGLSARASFWFKDPKRMRAMRRFTGVILIAVALALAIR